MTKEQAVAFCINLRNEIYGNDDKCDAIWAVMGAMEKTFDLYRCTTEWCTQLLALPGRCDWCKRNG